MADSSSVTATRTSSIGDRQVARRPVGAAPSRACQRTRSRASVAGLLQDLAKVAGAREHAAGLPTARVGIDLDRHRRPRERAVTLRPPAAQVKIRPYRRSAARWSHAVAVPDAALSAGSLQFDAGARRARRDPEQGAHEDPGIGPALVGEDRDGDRPRRAASAPPSGTRAADRNGRASARRRSRRAGRRGRTARAACRVAVRVTSPSIAVDRVGLSTPPPYSARAQRARSLAFEAMPPAPPAAVTTEVNGMSGLPSDRSIGAGILVASIRSGSRAPRPTSATRSAGTRCGAGRAARGSGRGAGRRGGPPRLARPASRGRGSSCSSNASPGRA